jgi:hypothetical protein
LKDIRFTTKLQYSIIALILMSAFSMRALAQNGHSHTSQHDELTSDQKGLVKAVKEATERFKNPKAAENAGYALLFGCVSGPDFGAMGMHFVNLAILDETNKTGVMDAARPQIVLYEPTSDGGLRLTGADYLVFADAWNAKHPEGPPELMGQHFHFFETPNRFGLPAFYTLHVWAWKENPNGAFVNWHPNVACEKFSGQTP